MAKAAGVTIAYAEAETFRYEAALNNAVTFALSGAADESGSVRLRAEMQKRTKKLAIHDGETCDVRCEWIKDGVLHLFERGVDWYDDFVDLTLEVSEQQERVAVQEASAQSDAEEKRLRALGEQLARHPRFAEANGAARRRFVAAQLFPNEEDTSTIVEHADMLHWWDIEPNEREQTAKQVRKLYDSGITMRAI